MQTGTISAKNKPPVRIIDSILEAEGILRSLRATESPRLDAEMLLASLLRIQRAALVASYFDQLEKRKTAEYFSLVRRRANGEPIAYITGEKEFMGFTFRVDPRALVPRPETETLVEYVVELVRESECGCDRILDVGTGCGCIAVSLALLIPQASVYATDISPEAIDLARLNAATHRVAKRMTFLVGDAYSTLGKSLRDSFDLIVSNPPYVSDAEYSLLDKGIRDFEPSIALKGGEDGLAVFRRIAAGAADFLADGGVLALEIGEHQAEKAAAILADGRRLAPVEVVRDLFGKERVVVARKIR